MWHSPVAIAQDIVAISFVVPWSRRAIAQNLVRADDRGDPPEVILEAQENSH